MPVRSRRSLTADQAKVLKMLRARGGSCVYFELEGDVRKAGISKVSIESLVAKGYVTHVARTPAAPARYKVAD
jgi:hypothetical protein